MTGSAHRLRVRQVQQTSRVRNLRDSMDCFVPLDWQQAVACGACADRADYLLKLQNVCIAGSELAVREQYAAKDVELLQMVRTLDEMDTVINLLSERVADWHQNPAPVIFPQIPQDTGSRAGKEHR